MSLTTECNFSLQFVVYSFVISRSFNIKKFMNINNINFTIIYMYADLKTRAIFQLILKTNWALHLPRLSGVFVQTLSDLV